MSLARLRRSSRFVAALLLLVSVCGLPHRSEGDDVCLPAVEEHDQSNHVYTAIAAAEHPQHCAICHWLRWMKPVFSSSVIAAAHIDQGTDLATSTALSLRDPGSDQLPARAPPVL